MEPAHEAVVDIRTLADKTGLETQEIIDLLRIFRDTTLADLGQMGQRLCLEDFPEVSRCAHSIRGAALNLSLRYLAEAAEVVEDCAREGKSDKLRTSFARLLERFQDVARFLDASEVVPIREERESGTPVD